jgi:hypothetical protein
LVRRLERGRPDVAPFLVDLRESNYRPPLSFEHDRMVHMVPKRAPAFAAFAVMLVCQSLVAQPNSRRDSGSAERTAQQKAFSDRARRLAREFAVHAGESQRMIADMEDKKVRFLERERQIAIDVVTGCIRDPPKCFKPIPARAVLKLLMDRGLDALETAGDLADISNALAGHTAKGIRLAQKWKELERAQEEFYRSPRNRAPRTRQELPPLPPLPPELPMADLTPKQLEEYADDANLWCWQGINGNDGLGDRCFSSAKDLRAFARKHPEVVAHPEAATRTPDIQIRPPSAELGPPPDAPTQAPDTGTARSGCLAVFDKCIRLCRPDPDPYIGDQLCNSTCVIAENRCAGRPPPLADVRLIESVRADARCQHAEDSCKSRCAPGPGESDCRYACFEAGRACSASAWGGPRDF